MTLQAEDIAFWTFALAALAVIIWMLIGSPTLKAGIIAIGIFIISSEFALWRNHFKMDKKTAISFVKLKNDINNLKTDLTSRLDNITNLIKK